jgi:hypothetical protein
MDISYLIQILERKVIILNNAKSQAFAMGDLEGINTIDKELLGVQNTLAQLGLLTTVTEVAVSTGTTPAEVVATAVGAAQNQTQGPSASAIVNGYDISAYATDALHEQKIQSIVNAMPAMTLASDIDTYIGSLVENSPVTGEMIMTAATLYNVDVPLIIAIIQNDSSFGTLGVGARTNNPGNVGNTGFAEQTYPSWQEGVIAVAEWLNRHRVTEVVIPTPTQPTPEPNPVTVTPVAPAPASPVTPTPVATSTASTTPSITPTPDTASTTPSVATTTPEVASSTPDITDTASTTEATSTNP